LFELGEEALDTPSVLVGDDIIGPLDFTMLARWNDGFAALFADQRA
jgi:hypothetical protein